MNDDKKKRLINAAIAFVADGETPTTRQLVERAGVNIAAINYYFQGKDNLMAVALDEAALSNLNQWIEENLGPSLDPHTQLRTFCQYLGRIHLKFWTFSQAQLRNIVLKGRRERATARATSELRRLVEEVWASQSVRTGSRYKAQVASVSIMSSIHYISIFHPHFDALAGFQIESQNELYLYVDEILAAQGLLREEI